MARGTLEDRDRRNPRHESTPRDGHDDRGDPDARVAFEPCLAARADDADGVCEDCGWPAGEHPDTGPLARAS